MALQIEIAIARRAGHPPSVDSPDRSLDLAAASPMRYPQKSTLGRSHGVAVPQAAVRHPALPY